MFFDLNIPIESAWHTTTPSNPSSKKSKGKAAPQQQDLHHAAQSQLPAIEARIDLLVHLGYTVLAFTQTIFKKFDPKTHTNLLDVFVPLLRPRTGILYLKRLNIILDEDSEKGFGLINAHTSFFSSYDLLSLTPTTLGSFSLACLTHTLPSPLTTHIISLPLTLPRLDFHLKHTLVRTALKNGAAFELCYVGSLGGKQDPVLADNGYAESGLGAKRNWWAAAREVVRVTKGKGIVVSGGAMNDADVRGPKDVANLITLLGIPQDASHHAMTTTPKSITVRAQTRRTYRTMISEPKIVIPEGSMGLVHRAAEAAARAEEEEAVSGASNPAQDVSTLFPAPATSAEPGKDDADDVVQAGIKRPREDSFADISNPTIPPVAITEGGNVKDGQQQGLAQGQVEKVENQLNGQIQPTQKEGGEGSAKKKKRKKNNRPLEKSVRS